MNFKQLLLIFFILINSLCFSQKLELGKVSVAELQEKKHPRDSSAAAAILFNKSKTVFVYQKEGFYMEHHYSFRIKIYKNEGLAWANKKVYTYIDYKSINDDYVDFFDCVTYNLLNNKIEKNKLKSEGKFTSKYNKYYNQTAITMPNVKIGSVIEYKYIIRSEYFTEFPKLNFQEIIPVNYAEYVTEIPEFFIYNPIFTGFINIKTDVQVGFGYQNFADKNFQGLHMDYKQINSVHKAENIPALKNENFVDNVENYRSSVTYELLKKRFPNVPEINFTETWENVAKNLFEDKHFGDEINIRSYYLKSLNLILQDIEKNPEKLNIIFNFVKNKMSWNQQNGIFADKGVIKAFEDNSGNAAEINFILIAMLNHAGFNANPVLISTKDNGIAVYPTRTAFNFVIASVEIDGKFILLDATSKFAALNIMPIKNLNWTGRLIRQDGSSKEIELKSEIVSTENIKLKAVVENNGVISGKTQIQKDNFNAFNFRQNYAGLNYDEYLEKLESVYNRIDVYDYKIENKLTNLEKPIIEAFGYKTKYETDVINGKIYFRPLLFYTISQNLFKETERSFPIDFEFNKEKNISVILQIPDDYEIETMPSSISIATPENIISFKYSVAKNNNFIQISTTFKISKSIVPADFYDVLKDFYRQMIEKQNEKIVLKKI